MSLKNYDPARMFEKVDTLLVFPFKSKVGETSIHVPEERLEDKGQDEVRAHVMRSHDAFRRAEEWAQTREYVYTDEEALEHATDFYRYIFRIIVTNCYSIYTARLDDDTKEAHAEREYLEKLPGEINAETAINSAEALCEQYLKIHGLEHAREIASTLDTYLVKHVAATAILEADREVPKGAPKEVWGEAFERHYEEYAKREHITYFLGAYAQGEAEDTLENDLKPVEMPLERHCQVNSRRAIPVNIA